jgi:hypothetical protein
MTESQIGEYRELININLNKIKKQVNQIEPKGGNRERYDVINSILEDIRRTVEIMDIDEYREELNKKEKKNK